MSEMTENKPYLIRAIYDWIVDNGCTPYLAVDATLEGVQVPPQYVSDGQVTLNLSPSAVRSLDLGNDSISFSASFGGVVNMIIVPIYSVLAIFAKENGQGMAFDVTPKPAGPDDGPTSSNKSPKSKPEERPGLRVVK